MTGTPVGTIFAELDLDTSRYTRAQKGLLKDATTTTLNIESNFKKLGVKSSAEFDLLRAKAQNSFERIKNSAQSTANDIVRAERAKNAQLKSLQEQQYGVQVGMMQKIKSNWLGMTAAITAAYFAAQKAWNVAEQAAQYEQSRMAFRSMVQSMGKDAESEFQKIKKASAGLVDNKSLVESANKAMSLGISIESLAGLMEIARVKARDMGTNTTSAFNDIAIGIGRASPKILDNLGIMVKIGTANEAVAASIGKTVEQLTDKEKQMAVERAVLEAGKESLERYDLSVKTSNERMQTLKATLTDINLVLGQGVVRAASLAAAGIHYLAAGVSGLIAAYARYRAFIYRIMGDEEKEAANMRYVNAALETRTELLAESENFWKLATARADELSKAMMKVPASAAQAGGAITEEMQEALKSIRDVYTDQMELESSLVAHIKESRDEITGYVTNAANAGYVSIREAVIAEKELTASLAKEVAEEVKSSIETQKRDLNGLEDYWKHTMENIHDATADAIYDIIDNWAEGFTTLFDSIKTWFKRMLAEMIATALANPIKIALTTVMGSALTGGTAAASGGGIFDLSGISNLFSGASSGWNVLGSTVSSGNFLEWSDTAINWGNVAGYIGLAYEAYNLFSSIGKQKYLTSAGIAIGTGVGAVLGGGPVGAAIGAGIGDLVGGILDSVFGLGESAPEFTLSELNTKYTSGAGPGAAYDTTKWTKGAGLSTGYFPEYSSDWGATPTVAHTAIAKAYAKGRKEITENFNEQMQKFLEALPSSYLAVVEGALAGMDFTYLVSGERWEFADAQSVIENLLLNYADFLSGKFDDIVNVVSAAYFEQDISTSDLYSKLSSGKQGQVSGLLTGGNVTGEEFNAFLTDWNTLLGVMASFEKFVNPSAVALSTFEQVTKNVGDQFDAYIDTLERAGVEVSKLGDLEQMRADTIEREVAALQSSFWTDLTEKMTLLYSGMTDLEKETYKLKKSFDEYYNAAVDLGLSEVQLAQIREWEATALDQLATAATDAVTAIDDISSALDRISELAGKIAGQSADDIRMTMISQRYNWTPSTYGTPSTGYNWDRIMAVYQQGFGLEDLQRIAASLGIDWTTIADDIEYLVDKFYAMKAALKSLTASLEDQYAQLTMSDKDYAIYRAQAQLTDTRAQIDELYQRGIMTTSEYNRLSNLALGVYWQTVNQLTEEAGDNIDRTVEAASRAWHSLIDNIKSSILDLTTSSDNQADAVERLGIAAQAIRDYTGGASMDSYLSGLSSDEDRRNAIETMMDMYGTYLGVAQDAYQRPSVEYQAIYQEVLSAYQEMQGLAEGYVSDYDIQLQQLAALQSIANNTATIGGYATGTDYVPKTGIYMLHQGEKVVKAGEGGGGPVYFSLTINGSNMNPREARQEFETFLTSNRGRKIVQQAATRH